VKLLEAVEALYEARPYPPVGFLSPLQPLRRDDLPLLNYRAAYASSFGSTAGAAERPRILVAGCGTFEPVAVAAANPGAEILAVDLSKKSLEKLRWQARWRGKSGQIRRLQGDLEGISRLEGKFDYVIATGVLHHLENPARGLRHILTRTYPRAVFRCMVYSEWGRDLLYGAKKLAIAMGADTPRKFRRLMGSLPGNHPYRIYYHLYEDAKTDGGLCDGYLHPCDQPLPALGWKELFEGCGLEATRFLQRPEGLPAAADRSVKFAKDQGLWERMAYLEAIGALEENLIFFARRASESGLAVDASAATSFEWNPALLKKGTLRSRLLGLNLTFDTSRHPSSLDEATRRRFLDALLLLPKGNG